MYIWNTTIIKLKQKEENEMKKVWKSMDYSLLLPLVILCVLGVIMVYSSSSIVCDFEI